MRLINVHTLEIEEFLEDGIPDYSILSHTWGFEEASFQQWARHPNPAESTKQGFLKVLSACKLSRREGFKYTWVDTVCIDKSNSVELTEALNSMFKWYRDSSVCYAYLEDFQQYPGKARIDELRTCRWFTRGWTLQELIAPATVKFHDRTWTMIGTKSELAKEISEITSINEKVLHNSGEVARQSVAQRMSWLVDRNTTRKEDIAYCMIGIFDLSMPVMYGEGKKAFFRLQEEIIKETNDRTIFCWTWPDTIPPPTRIPCLAPHPSAFRDAGQYVPDRRAEWRYALGYSVTNNVGIRTQLRIATCTSELSFAVLDVTRADDPSEHLIALPLVRATSRPSWGKSEVVWRAPYPATPIRVPSTWPWMSRELTLSRPGLDHYDTDPLPQYISSLSGSWLKNKVSPFAALVLNCADQKQGQIAHLARSTQSCPPLIFFQPTRSPRVWNQSVHFRTRSGDYPIHLAIWLGSDGTVSWRAGLDALELDAPVSVMESQVSNWGSKVEFRVSGQDVDGVGCLYFARDEMGFGQNGCGFSEGLVVRPASFSVHLPGRRKLLE